MVNKGLWMIIFTLVVTNCLTLGFLFKGNNEHIKLPEAVETATIVSDEVVATVGSENISKQEWLHELEKLYGKETLKELINRKVISQLAQKYNISVSPDVINQELAMLKSMYNSLEHDQEELIEEHELKKQIEDTIVLEEILTKDVTIPDELIKGFYKENKDLYHIPDTYHISHLIVKTKEESDEVKKELLNGSDFSVLAMERSTDEFSASQGGSLGFVSLESEYLPEQYLEALSSLEATKWAGPLEVNGEFAFVYLHEKIKGKKYSYDDVKDHIRRQIALGQIDGKMTAEKFWDEVDVNWFYESNN
jgi:foldase protein PrsA